MYDWLLGGINNYASDQRACEDLLRIAPGSKALALTNRAFLRRVVRTLADEYGIDQFLDHGSGLPTQDNVHQIAQRINPDTRVVYVDIDPIVLAHGRALLDENDNTAVIQADMTNTEYIFGHPSVSGPSGLIDLERPVAVLFNSVLHCVPDSAGPREVIRRVARRLAPGSFLVICQLVSDNETVRREVTRLMLEQTQGNWGRVRRKKDVHDYFEGLEVLPPGIVEVSTWRAESEVGPRQNLEEWEEYGGVGRIPVPR